MPKIAIFYGRNYVLVRVIVNNLKTKGEVRARERGFIYSPQSRARRQKYGQAD